MKIKDNEEGSGNWLIKNKEEKGNWRIRIYSWIIKNFNRGRRRKTRFQIIQV